MSQIRQFIERHPNLAAWVALSVGFVVILVWSARDVGLEPGQWIALILATIGVAGLSVWIISWEEEAPPEEQEAPEEENEEI